MSNFPSTDDNNEAVRTERLTLTAADGYPLIAHRFHSPSPPRGHLVVGGATAEQVARQRGVSLMTVRVQIRSILGKSACENLRELEHQMATLAAHVPQGRVASA